MRAALLPLAIVMLPQAVLSVLQLGVPVLAPAFIADAGLALEEITRQTIPRDFARKPRTHNCWRIRHRPDA